MQRLRTRQIHLPTLKRSPRKLPWFRHPNPATECRKRIEGVVDGGVSAVDVQFERGFGGVAVRGGEVDDAGGGVDDLVGGGVVDVAQDEFVHRWKARVGPEGGGEAEREVEIGDERAGDADDGDACSTGASGQSEDGIVGGGIRRRRSRGAEVAVAVWMRRNRL
ncbi:gamma-tubulin ring complex protein [Pseudozyma hubeiensis SY62]|uniref:Gamma-tubulin ring complex protein n=1 Tax=Pseudozyma hubeiensis (strain SY62) TaxID=1305764 RepID=R9P6N0_PSEHS|nr:gamma-tubulin ring complex protein [Pseudozyma hubeiensis SY62]GAC96882.1 gamma-tubulin ring complex protein [Pseudozyma hubeiensis SY62]